MQKIIPHIFYFFLLAPILSPFVGGITIYLSSIFLLFDIKYLQWLLYSFYPKKIFIFLFLIILACILPLNVIVFVKCVYVSISISYIYYSYFNGKFKLYRYVKFNILFGLIQFILTIKGSPIAQFIGPGNISKLVWGAYATPTYTNFFEAYFLPRVSGLSREGGFFSALINITFLITYLDKNLPRKKKKVMYFFLILGLFITISKTSIIFLFGFLIICVKKRLNRIPLLVGYLGVGSLLVFLFWTLFQINPSFFTNISNETFIHRFSGYAFTPYLDLQNLITGVHIPELFHNANSKSSFIVTELKSKEMIDFCGYSALYLNNGLIFYILFYILLAYLNFTTTSLILLVLFTSDVTPISADGFVQLGWFCCLLLNRREPFLNIIPKYKICKEELIYG